MNIYFTIPESKESGRRGRAFSEMSTSKLPVQLYELDLATIDDNGVEATFTDSDVLHCSIPKK